MTSARIIAVSLAERDFFFPGSNHCKETKYSALGWIIEHYLLIPTFMSFLPDQFLALCTYDCGIPQWYWWATNFCLINKNSLPFLVEE